MSVNTKTHQNIRGLHSLVLSGETDRIPLIITPPCDPGPSREDFVSNTEAAVLQAAEVLLPKAEIGADWLPTINIGWYQCIAVPSLFGAPPVYLERSGAVVKPFFQSIEEAVDAGVPEIAGPVIDEMLAVLDKAVRSCPDGFYLSFPAAASPFDLVQLLLGEELPVALLSFPEDVVVFLDHLTQLCLRVTDLVKSRVVATTSEYVTDRGIWFPGFRLPSDALVNWSPDLLRQLALPVLERFGERYGKLCVHYGTKAESSKHILSVLCECECVAAVDTWQSSDVLIGDHVSGRLQDRVALIFDEDFSTGEKMDAFLNQPLVRDVPRKGGRALVMSTTAQSVDDGRRIYDLWQSKTNRA